MDGERIYLRDLSLEDVEKMRFWGRHKDPLMWSYNFPKLTRFEEKEWFKYKTGSFFKRYYAIVEKEDENIIGYLGIREINYIFKYSTLGIVLNPSYMEEGYGSEALKVFLDYYFYKKKMKKMFLDVDKFNKRAFNLYKKCGFKVTGEDIREFSYYEDYYEILDYIMNETYFVLKNEKIYNYIYKMEVTELDYRNSKINME